MAIELCWLASPAASSLHAAQAILDGRQLADQKIGEALAEPARALRRELAAWEIEPRSFFAHAIPLTVPNDSSEKLAEAVVARLIGQSATSIIISGVARRVAALQAAFNETHPQATTELSLRAGPLAEQWEARGPGLIAAIGRATDKALLAERADVILLQPILGGDGTVFPLYGAVAIEAVLANPIAELPEVVRLGWLLAQLNRRQTPFQPTEPCAHDALSMIMPTLWAAEHVELARLNLETIAAAIRSWTRIYVGERKTSVEIQGKEIEWIPDRLMDWWTAYQSTSVSWSEARADLKRRIPAILSR
ncbi:MAG TPA: hypothetical protein VHV08_10315 [Pirellulales bacterium]|nr:hypothetical protein [Pirellulales bacterium]